MADLLDRVLGYLDPVTESDLSVSGEVLIAAMIEFRDNHLTPATMKSALSLTDADFAGLTTVYTQIFVAATMSLDQFRALIALGSTRDRAAGVTGPAYYSKATVKTRLGL